MEKDRSEDEKLAMAYLAFGNSAYDILGQYIDLLKETGRFDEMFKGVKEDIEFRDQDHDIEENPNESHRVCLLGVFEELEQDINSPIIG